MTMLISKIYNIFFIKYILNFDGGGGLRWHAVICYLILPIITSSPTYLAISQVGPRLSLAPAIAFYTFTISNLLTLLLFSTTAYKLSGIIKPDIYRYNKEKYQKRKITKHSIIGQIGKKNAKIPIPIISMYFQMASFLSAINILLIKYHPVSNFAVANFIDLFSGYKYLISIFLSHDNHNSINITQSEINVLWWYSVIFLFICIIIPGWKTVHLIVRASL